MKPFNSCWLVLAALFLSSCGGGGDGAGQTPGGSPGIPPIQTAQQCAPNNPFAAASLKTGSLSVEKQWLQGYMNDAYLWFDEVPAVNPDAPQFSQNGDVFGSIENYFNALRTPVLTSTNARKDRFSFIVPTTEFNQMLQGGMVAGYGFEILLGSPTPPRNIRIAYVEPGSPAAANGVMRGDQLVTVDGISADDNTNAGIDTLNNALFPISTGTPHSFVFSRAGSSGITVNLSSTTIVKKPVLTRSVITAADGAKVGYIVFNDHLATAEEQLIEAVNFLSSQNVTELVLDLRYNGGGFLFVASELAYMIAGPARTNGKVFEKLTYNAKRVADNNSPNSSTAFFNTSCFINSNFNCTNQQPLPTLNLPRVYVLTQSGTCSASESVINSLRGVDVEVRQIGGTTCGKPYGFTAKDNCGISYLPIEFKGTNAKGFGDYPDGFIPGGSGPTNLPGCPVADDLSRALGDSGERMLAAALSHRLNGSCPSVTAGIGPRALGASEGSSGTMLRHALRESRLLLPSGSGAGGSRP